MEPEGSSSHLQEPAICPYRDRASLCPPLIQLLEDPF